MHNYAADFVTQKSAGSGRFRAPKIYPNLPDHAPPKKVSITKYHPKSLHKHEFRPLLCTQKSLLCTVAGTDNAKFTRCQDRKHVLPPPATLNQRLRKLRKLRKGEIYASVQGMEGEQKWRQNLPSYATGLQRYASIAALGTHVSLTNKRSL